MIFSITLIFVNTLISAAKYVFESSRVFGSVRATCSQCGLIWLSEVLAKYSSYGKVRASFMVREVFLVSLWSGAAEVVKVSQTIGSCTLIANGLSTIREEYSFATACASLMLI